MHSYFISSLFNNSLSFIFFWYLSVDDGLHGNSLEPQMSKLKPLPLV